MSIPAAALLAAISGAVTGWLWALLKHGGETSRSVALHVVVGSLVATLAFGIFLIPGYVVGLIFFSGPPKPAIALLGTLLGELACLVVAAGQRLLGRLGNRP